MTVLAFPRPTAEASPTAGQEARLWSWLRLHRISLLVAGLLMFVTGLIHGINFDGYPGRLNDDEGTYAAQAWAILTRGDLAHYTYWYDHPPFGWMQIAGYAWLTNGFDRAATAVTVGREVMLIADVASAALLYLLARRLQFSRVAASAAVLLFVVSPLALFYHRMVFLDNIAVAWMLAAFVFAASPRRSLGAAFGSAVCFAGTVLTKETLLIVLPSLLWLLLQHRPRRDRGWTLGVFLPSFIGLCMVYPLYAVLKNELLEGEGHVSLMYAIKWQLFERESTGSVLDSGSISHATAAWWMQLDPWLLAAGALLMPFALFVRRLGPIALALGIQLVMILREGYLPQPYVIALVPFAALVVAGMGDALWKSQLIKSAAQSTSKFWRTAGTGVSRSGVALLLAVIVLFGVNVAPGWTANVHTATTVDHSQYSAEATQWIIKNVPKNATIIVDDNIWTDLQEAGYPNVVWLFKADLDPAVKEEFFQHGYRDADYVVRLPLSEDLLRGLPTVWEALQHSEVVQTFGHDEMLLRIHKVKKR